MMNSTEDAMKQTGECGRMMKFQNEVEVIIFRCFSLANRELDFESDFESDFKFQKGKDFFSGKRIVVDFNKAERES